VTQVGGVAVHVDERGALDASPPVLLLHGASFTADVWDESGIADRLAESGLHVVAVDLPGYGRTPRSSLGGADFLAALIDVVAPGGAVVVSPSMSGGMALALLAAGDGGRLAGFVPVAPVGIAGFSLPHGAEPPETMIVWGSEDDLIPVEQASVLAAALPGSRIEVIDGAGHAAYLADPERFADLLIDFVGTR